MSAIEKWMKNWKGDWAFMEQPEKDLYMAVEAELAAMQSVIEAAQKVAIFNAWIESFGSFTATEAIRNLVATLSKLDGMK